MSSQVSNPYYKGVKVCKKAVRVVRRVVSNGFYNKSKEEQIEGLGKITSEICDYYNIISPKIAVDKGHEYYQPHNDLIGLPKSTSIISLLHELRHHIQFQADKCYKGHNKEEDARAWSLRVFKLACPNSFKRSIKRGNIMHIEWDREEEKVVNERGY